MQAIIRPVASEASPREALAAAATNPNPGAAGAVLAFRWPLRVYYEDTDAAGVVYYAHYLRFMERCRSEWLRALGFGQQNLAREHGVRFVVAAAQISYLLPARLDDELMIDARICEHHRSYVVFEQRVLHEARVICRGEVKVACVDATSLRPARLPEALAALLALARNNPTTMTHR